MGFAATLSMPNGMDTVPGGSFNTGQVRLHTFHYVSDSSAHFLIVLHFTFSTVHREWIGSLPSGNALMQQNCILKNNRLVHKDRCKYGQFLRQICKATDFLAISFGTALIRPVSKKPLEFKKEVEFT